MDGSRFVYIHSELIGGYGEVNYKIVSTMLIAYVAIRYAWACERLGLNSIRLVADRGVILGGGFNNERR